MSVDVVVSDEAVDIRFTGWDSVWTLQRHVRIPMADVVDARVARQADLKPDLGWRVGGTYWPGRVAAGHYTTRHRRRVRQLWCCYAAQDVLVVETRLDRPWRIVLQHPDRDFLAWIIAERLHR